MIAWLGKQALLPNLEQVETIYSLSVAEWPTAKHWPDMTKLGLAEGKDWKVFLQAHAPPLKAMG